MHISPGETLRFSLFGDASSRQKRQDVENRRTAVRRACGTHEAVGGVRRWRRRWVKIHSLPAAIQVLGRWRYRSAAPAGPSPDSRMSSVTTYSQVQWCFDGMDVKSLRGIVHGAEMSEQIHTRLIGALFICSPSNDGALLTLPPRYARAHAPFPSNIAWQRAFHALIPVADAPVQRSSLRPRTRTAPPALRLGSRRRARERGSSHDKLTPRGPSRPGDQGHGVTSLAMLVATEAIFEFNRPRRFHRRPKDPPHLRQS